ncbi:MAG: glycosyltransferase family 4 protein [Actinomycetota bacterium]
MTILEEPSVDTVDPITRPRRVLWYWPFARPEEMSLATAFAADGTELTVQVVDRDAAPTSIDGATTRLRRDLADIDRTATGVRWPTSRVATYLRRSARRRSAIAEVAPDLVHVHYLNRFTDQFGRPDATWVVSVHDVEPHQPRLGRLERALTRRLHRRPDGLIVHHRWLADRLVHDHGVDPDRIAVVPHQVFPVDAPAARPTTDRPRLLCFGALRPNKGLPWLIGVMQRPELTGIELMIAGRGDATEEARIRDLVGDAANITLELGYVTTERKNELFRSCSAVVMPYESFASQSGVLHDAYGHGRPVVVTDVGALGTTVRHDRTGEVVDHGDDDALVTAIETVLGPAGDDDARQAATIAVDQSPARIAEQLRLAYERFGA